MNETAIVPVEEQTTALVRTGAQHTALAIIVDQARQYTGQVKAPNTLRAYRNDWQDSYAWCEAHGQVPLPASVESLVVFSRGSRRDVQDLHPAAPHRRSGSGPRGRRS